MEPGRMIRAPMRAWAEASLRRASGKLQQMPERRRRKFLVVHLDGVPLATLKKAMLDGEMPFLSSLVGSGAYHLDNAFWGSPASTPAFQAGLLYGLRHPNLPAYYWYDRELGKEVRMNVPTDAFNVESRLQRDRPRSLLAGGGTTYLSLFKADADNLLCMPALADLAGMTRRLVGDLRGLRIPQRQSVWAFLRALFKDAALTGQDVVGWVRKVRSLRHENQYLFNRFFMMSLGWELSLTRALVDMMRGVPAIYLVFGNYDEVAHRRGPHAIQALQQLYRVDAALEELYAVAHTLEEPYDLYFVTDHGHVDSLPFQSRNRTRLKEYLTQGDAVPLSSDVERGLLNGRGLNGEIRPPQRDEPVVIESGNFSHVYLSRGDDPLEAEALLSSHRAVLSRAIESPDIGIVVVRRRDHAVGIVRRQVFTADEIEHAPLPISFNRRAVADLIRELPHMKTAGDLVLFGQVMEAGGTVGFAWEFGSHGGLTHMETESLMCWPADIPLNFGGLSHSTQLYQLLASYYLE